MITTDTFANVTKAVAAAGTIEVVSTVPSPGEVDLYIKIISQICIVVATVFSLFRKKK